MKEYSVRLGGDEVKALEMLFEETEHDDSTYEWAVVLGVLRQIIHSE